MRVFFLASDNQQASGGLKFIYRFCELANELGFDAAVMHGKFGFRINNFNHEAPVVFNSSWKKLSRREMSIQTLRRALGQLLLKDRETEISPEDIIIIPENRLVRAHEIFPQNSKIVLNQNPFLAARQGTPRDEAEIIGTLSTSEICLEVSRRFLSEKPAFLVPYWLEREMFTPEKFKKLQIAYMPRRNAEDASMVFKLLTASGAINDVECVPISGMTLEQVAQTLRESIMFLSFADREGFGLPGAEAIASGCLTIGYTGIGGDEYFERFGGWPIAQQDILTYADTVAQVLNSYKTNPEKLDAARMKHASAILTNFDRKATKEALKIALRSIITT